MAESKQNFDLNQLPMKIVQVVSTRRTLPQESTQRQLRKLPMVPMARTTAKRGTKKLSAVTVARAKEALSAEVAKLPQSSREQHQNQYIHLLEKENSEMKSMLRDCRSEIVKMQWSLQFLLANVNKALNKEPPSNADQADEPTRQKIKVLAKTKPVSPKRNSDPSTSRKHQLPISTLESFKVFEKNLMSKEFFFNVIESLKSQKIATYIETTSKIGAQDSESVMTFVMKMLLAPQVLGQLTWSKRPDEQVFRNYHFFRSLFMFLVNKTCLSVLRKTIDPKTYENFFRVRIQRENILLQRVINSQIRKLKQTKNLTTAMEVDTDQCLNESEWQEEDENSDRNVLGHHIFGDAFDADTEIKQEPNDFDDIVQSNVKIEQLDIESVIKSEPTEQEQVVLNSWTAGSDNES